jgi:hypothetical protein
MIVYHEFEISHDLGIAAVGFLRHSSHAGAVLVEEAGRLGVEHKRDGEKTFDPF